MKKKKKIAGKRKVKDKRMKKKNKIAGKRKEKANRMKKKRKRKKATTSGS